MAATGGSRPRVLTFLPYYLPGYRAGGPIRSISNLVDLLSDDVEFLIVTSDRDAEDEEGYDGIAVDAWNQVGDASVFYAAPGKRSLADFRRLITSTPHAILYLNSFFHPVYTVKPLILRRLGRIPRVPTIVAPKGQLSEGALGLKGWKKNLFLRVVRAADLYDDLVWQASSEHEVEEIVRVMGVDRERIVVAPDLPASAKAADGEPSEGAVRERQPGDPLRIIFLSRITPKKNLDRALTILAEVRTDVEFRIVGPVRDEEYWRRCEALIDDLPDNVHVEYLGSVEYSLVGALLADQDLFFLPTKGENFGHVIPEAFAAGLPVLISDRTPWRQLDEHGVGWDLPLDDTTGFVAAVDEAAQTSAAEYRAWRGRARAFSTRGFTDADDVAANRELFEQARQLAPGGAPA